MQRKVCFMDKNSHSNQYVGSKDKDGSKLTRINLVLKRVMMA